MKNAPATFQEQINKVVRQRKGMFTYIDDIIIAATTLDELDRYFLNLADRLAEANMRLHPGNMRLHPGKTRFYHEYVTYLGYIIRPEEVKPDQKKLKAIAEYPTPGHPKQIKQFTGITGYYRRHVTGYSMKARPSFDLTIEGHTRVAGLGFSYSCRKRFLLTNNETHVSGFI